MKKLILIMAVTATTASFGQSLKISQTKRECSGYLFCYINDPTVGWKTTVLMNNFLGKSTKEVTWLLKPNSVSLLNQRLEKLWNYEKNSSL
jgi:hypothetical protein